MHGIACFQKYELYNFGQDGISTCSLWTEDDDYTGNHRFHRMNLDL